MGVGGWTRGLIGAVALATFACVSPTFAPPAPWRNSSGPAGTPTPSPIPTVVATPTATAQAPAPTFTPTPQPTPTSTPEPDPRLSSDGVQLFPQPLHAGDQFSVDVEVLLPETVRTEDLDGVRVTLTTSANGSHSSAVGPGGLDQQLRARFHWIAQLPETSGTVVFTLTLELPPNIVDPNPANNVAVLSAQLHPRDTLSPPEPAARWALTETTGFRVHYLTGSAAERDLDRILEDAYAAHGEVAAQLGEPDDPIDIYLIDRVIGQGGYASSGWVVVSYTDRRYAPVTLSSVFKHELVHRLDAAVGCDGAPPWLREGLAVYVAGGHYRPEPVREKAAALLGTTHYIPLDSLSRGFYTHQHEAAYLEAGAIVQFIVEDWGWDTLLTVCETVSSAGEDEQVNADDQARWNSIVAAMGYSNTRALEEAWQLWLRAKAIDPRTRSMLELELALMDAMRTYQAAYDAPAHFLEGILFSPEDGRRLDIVADFVRRPRTPAAIAIELVLAMAQEAVEQQDSVLLALLLEELDLALGLGTERSALVQDAVRITELALAQGQEPYRLVVQADRRFLVYTLDRAAWPLQNLLSARRVGGDWDLATVELVH